MAAKHTGRVIEIRGRRVLVRALDRDWVCFLSGKRAVVGDQVDFVEASGADGKLTGVRRRNTRLERVGFKGKHQILAANLTGVYVVVAPKEPPFRAGLVDRYRVAAAVQGLEVCLIVNKMDQGIDHAMEEALDLRRSLGLDILTTSVKDATGIDTVRAHLAASTGPWALVGHSGVGKTSLIGALLPEQDVGAVGELSEYWGTGKHTTTHSKLFQLPDGGELVDSPGIRTFTPAGLTIDSVRDHFPGIPYNICRYRDCQHREGEDGCGVVDAVSDELLVSYRRLLEDVRGHEKPERHRRSPH